MQGDNDVTAESLTKVKIISHFQSLTASFSRFTLIKYSVYVRKWSSDVFGDLYNVLGNFYDLLGEF